MCNRRVCYFLWEATPHLKMCMDSQIRGPVDFEHWAPLPEFVNILPRATPAHSAKFGHQLPVSLRTTRYRHLSLAVLPWWCWVNFRLRGRTVDLVVIFHAERVGETRRFTPSSRQRNVLLALTPTIRRNREWHINMLAYSASRGTSTVPERQTLRDEKTRNQVLWQRYRFSAQSLPKPGTQSQSCLN
jgi:hypothetical protein